MLLPSGDAVAGPCRWCDYIHGKICPFVKALEYDVAGNVTRVEFMAVEVKPAKEEEPPQEDYPKLGAKSGA